MGPGRAPCPTLTRARRWRHLPPGATARRTGEEPDEAPPSTLGDLIYARGTNGCVSENDWIALVQSVANGDQDALYTLYERTHRLVFTLMVRMTNDLATAEELTLDVFHD